MKLCAGDVPAEFSAVILNLCVPTGVVAAMVISPVESLMLTPAGTLPPSVNVIGVVPLAATWKVACAPCTTRALLPLVIDGRTAVAVTVKVNVRA